MTRADKIKLISSIQKGEAPISAVLPVIKASFIETKPGHFLDIQRFKSVPYAGMDSYVQRLREAHPKCNVVHAVMYQKEYLEFKNQLDEQY